MSPTRRQAILTFLALPLGARVAAQTRPGPRRRVILGNSEGLLLGADGSLSMWARHPVSDGTAPDSLGLGHNGPLPSFTLAKVPGLANVVAAAAGWNCAFAVLGDGRLLAWGKNPNGRLGTTTQAQMETLASWSPNASNKPLPLATPFDAVDVSAGDEHALALARDGSVYVWGVGKDGQLGIGPMPVINFKTRTPAAMGFMPVPVRVPDLGEVIAISAGKSHSLALLKNGTVRAWGRNREGQLGDGTTANRDRPIAVPGLRDVVAIAAGGASLALLANGTVMGWGQLSGDSAPQLAPAPVPGVRGVRAIAAGSAHAVALTDAGTVFTWGDNSHSQLGRGRGDSTNTAGQIKELTGVQSIASRHETTVAVLASGRIMTWGEVREFDRPGGGRSPRYSPVPIPMSVDGLENS
jgi:alpha-tubulin suppressor-like RCC1 family protein